MALAILQPDNNVVNLNRIAINLGYRPSAPAPSEERIGVDYIPPLNAVMKISVAQLSFADLPADLTAGGGVQAIPDTFDWRKRCAACVGPPRNQLGCGSCWAIGTTDMLADRYAIVTGRPRLALSATYLLSCDKELLGCAGGSASVAGEFLESKGTLPEACWDYKWCSTQSACVSGSGALTLTETLPACAKFKATCVSCTPRCKAASGSLPPHVHAKKGSTRSVQKIDDCKQEILTNGPIAATYHVFGDFICGTMSKSKFPKADKWAATNGIYVNSQSKDIYKYGKIDCSQGKQPAHKCSMGNHVICIVGWGRDLSVPGFGKVEYWVVRNSWGPAWNGNGYFKIAMTDESRDINTSVGLDIPLHINGVLFGGMTRVLPDTKMSTEKRYSASDKAFGAPSRTDVLTVIGVDNGRRWRGFFVYAVVLLVFLFVLFVAGNFVLPFDKLPKVINVLPDTGGVTLPYGPSAGQSARIIPT